MPSSSPRPALRAHRSSRPFAAWRSERARSNGGVAADSLTPRPRKARRRGECAMSYEVDFTNVSTVGLESSPVAPALAGLRANEARYFKNKYDHVFAVSPADDAKDVVEYVHRILKEERDIVISSPPLEATSFEVDGLRMAYVFYESGLSINVMY